MKTRIVDLEWFDGQSFELSAVSTDIERFKAAHGEDFADAEGMSLVLDGNTYTAIQDPKDGYRSSLAEIFVDRTPVPNAFTPITVIARYISSDTSTRGECDIVQFLAESTKDVIVEIGTARTDDYYPYFVDRFEPELLTLAVAKDVLNAIKGKTATVAVLDEFTAEEIVDPNLKDPQWGSW